MAGSYADYLDHRIPYHLDGTRVFYRTLVSPTELTPAQIVTMNDEDSDGLDVSQTGGYFMFMFPRACDITGYYVSYSANLSFTTPYLEVSSDTTNFTDGTWSNLGSAGFFNGGLTIHQARSSITAITTSNTIAARIYYYQDSLSARSMGFYAFHFYGSPSSGIDGDRVWLWHDTLDQRLGPAALDWGNINQGIPTSVKTFRVKNSSATKSAIATVVAGLVPTDGTTTVASTMQFSLDNTNWTATVTLPDLAAGAISQVVYMRFNVLLSTAFGIRIPVVTATPVSMT